MKKLKENTIVKKSKSSSKNRTKTKVKTNGVNKNTIIYPAEFEEDQNMKIRMKPQPYKKHSKK